MHIPDSLLAGHACPVTLAVSAAGVTAVALAAVKSRERPALRWFASVSAFIFAAQMLNYPVAGGTSGHLIGAALAVLLLGIPFGILSLTLVVTVQCFLFLDGGASALGANIFNMAIIPGVVTGVLCRKGTESGVLKIGMVSGVSVLLAALACSAEIAFSGKGALAQVSAVMLGAHAGIGAVEGLLTVLFCQVFQVSPSGFRGVKGAAALSAVAAGLVMLSPFASPWPDALEKGTARLNLLHQSMPAFTGLLKEYRLPGIASDYPAQTGAGFFGPCGRYFPGGDSVLAEFRRCSFCAK